MSNLQSHVIEMKLRFFYLIFSTVSTFCVLYSYKQEIIYLIGKPFVEFQQTFIFLDLTEAFSSLLKISAIWTCLLILPYIIYQSWSFWIPSRYQQERNALNFLCVLSLCLWSSEGVLLYLVLLPKICSFLLSFEITPAVESTLTTLEFHSQIRLEFTARLQSYVDLVVKISSVVFLFFQIPLCVCFLYYKKLVDVSLFYTNRKILSFVSLLISAFLVPPDAITQFVVAFFLYLVFEFLIFVGVFFQPQNG